jgi:hypothetical protein
LFVVKQQEPLRRRSEAVCSLGYLGSGGLAFGRHGLNWAPEWLRPQASLDQVLNGGRSGLELLGVPVTVDGRHH